MFLIGLFAGIILISGCAQRDKISFSQCLPSNIKLGDIVTASISGYENGKPVGLHKVTVEQKLTEIGASCQNNKLVDSNGKEIYFYFLTGCWGTPPYNPPGGPAINFQEILQTQRDELSRLNEQFTVIEMTCNPSGIPIP